MIDLFDYTYNIVRQIPDGMVSSYGAVAEALGDKIAARAVGRMMNQNPNADDMPCYKIVHSNGDIGGFGRGIDDKIRRLNQVGIKVNEGKILDFENVFFNEFKSSQPLKDLRNEQISLSSKVKNIVFESDISYVAGFDVSYPKSEWEDVCGAVVLIDYKSGEIVERRTVLMKTFFPYISTYFSYRELPVLIKLFKSLKIKPDVSLFDGNGILHPYRIGLASHVGVILNIASIGVAKRLLYGTVVDDFVLIDGERRGFAFCSNSRVKNPVYISPGNLIDLDSSVEIVKNLSRFRIPEPLRSAHILSKKSLS